ncbi:MAG: enoyl-CoA hydratase-related protein [Dehalococcoidia bacterium]|jgi:2-(1,2-epoxy-1,2-dihydrophenyl)acetyl-CoA isomerase|nr:enoyl-CoA hydratase-related protein [Dehalococcoidia bacterium]MDP7470644.1 enoyl-CoA hydratase-related protein [Dehalococcoidia bacterium]
MEFRDTIYIKEDGVAVLTFNRPRTLNDLDTRMGEEWVAALKDAQQDPEVRALVVTGQGRAFSAGGDPRNLLSSRETFVRTGQWQGVADLWEIVRAAVGLEKPYIAAVNGAAVGGGFDLITLCDLRVASDYARFGTGFVRMGEVPAIGCYTLPRLVGVPRALDLLWTGRLVKAQEALSMGLVNQVLSEDELLPTARRLALELARGPGLALRHMKRLVYDGLGMDLQQALQAHIEAARAISNTEDAYEGPRAWIEKREPLFKGR